MPDFISKLFDTSDFPDRWRCGQWSDFHGWLHIVSDIAVFGAYVTIPFVLLYFLRRRKDVPFPKVFLLFVAFVFACGTVHLIEATIFWWPIYRVSAVMKLITAIVSWATVIGVVRILPSAIKMRSAAELEAEIFKRKAAELRFRAILESAPDATVVASEQGDVVFFNKESERLFGYERDELLDRPVSMLFPKRSRTGHSELIVDFIKNLSEHSECESQEISGLKKDGSEFPIELSHSPIETAEGRLISIAIRDVTDRVARQEELEREHAKVEAILNSIPDALMFANADRKITYCNPAVEQVFGYDPNELIGLPTAVLYADSENDERQCSERFPINADQQNRPFELEWKRKDGTLFPGETIGTLVRKPSGSSVGFLGLIRDMTERSKAKESLRIQEQALQSERKLADEIRSSLGLIVEEALDEIFVCDVETLTYVQVNRRGRDNIGYEMEELLNMSPEDICVNMTPDSLGELAATLRASEDGSMTIEKVHRRKDGSCYNAEARIQLGSYLGREAFVGFVRDVTERNKTQNALLESEQRFSAFMDNSPFVAWVKDAQGRHQYFSRAYQEEIGIPPGDWIGKTEFDLWPAEIAQRHHDTDMKVLETRKTVTFEAKLPLPDGQLKNWYVLKFPFHVNSDEVFIGGIAVDMTEQRRAESERDRFFETSGDMMCIANFEKYFTRVNQACTDILGYTREELLSRPFTDFIHPDDLGATVGAVALLREGGQVIQFENRYRHKNGSYRVISWTTPDPEPDGEVIFAIGRDITERRSMERSLLQIADNEQRRISHDLHDGLGQELAGTSMMARSLANKLIEKSQPESELAMKIAELLGESLELSRSLARGLRPVEIDTEGLQAGLMQLADRISEAYPAECSFHGTDNLQPNDPEFATHLYRIAQEAVTNAAKHGKPKTIEIHLDSFEDALELKVVDDGDGINSAAESGEGIGMQSMRYRSNIIGAKLNVQSNRPAGTIVVCRLRTG